jgi:uncharacterized membrane protein
MAETTAAAQTAAKPDLQLVLPGRSAPAGAGWDWVVQGWGLFTRAPLMWILSIIIVFVIAVVMAFVPIIGSLAFQLLQGVFAGGFVAACRVLEKDGDFELEHLFSGFTKRFVPLMLVGLITLLAWVAILLVFFAFAGFSLIAAFMSGDPNSALAALTASAASLIIGGLVVLALMVPLMAAYWFAPALVMMNDMSAGAAMKESLFACFRNFVPFLIYGIVMLVAAIIAAIPFGLGYLVWMPVAIASTYAAYRQIFTEGAWGS